MRIGVDAREIRKGSYTGLRTILSDLLAHAGSACADEFVLFCDRFTDLEALPSSCRKHVIDGNNTLWWDQVRLPMALKREEIDVFFSPYIKTPLWRVCPYVNTIADIIPLTIPKERGLEGLLEKAYFFTYAFLCGRRAVKVMSISEDAKAKITKVFGIGRDKISVIYPSVAAPPDGPASSLGQVMKTKYSLDRPYILYVGNYKPHKNLERLIDAYRYLPPDVRDNYQLVLLGGSPYEWAELFRMVEEQGLEGKVVPIMRVKPEDKTAFLKNASVFVFPSLCEGFGIPPLEAMAAGVPVASSRLAPMTEVLGDAASFFDPLDHADMARAILRLLSDSTERARLIEKGRERSGLFKSEEMTEKILRLLKEAGSSKTLLVSSEFPPVTGGMATQVFNLWKRLPRERTAILTAKVPGKAEAEEEDLDIVKEKYPLGHGACSRAARTLLVVWHMWRQNSVRRIKRNHCAQIISAGLGGLIIKKLKDVPFVVYVYSADILEFSKNKVTRSIMRRVLEESELVIANSNFTKSVVQERGLAAPHKITVLTPGVDTENFSADKGAGDIRRRYGIDGTTKVVLTVSRLVPRKGHDAVIKVMPRLIEEFPSAAYIIAGDGPEKPRLEELVREKHLERNVIFAGEVLPGELVHFYNACDVFVMVPRLLADAGDSEGFGIVFLEASACGKPVVAGKSGGVAEAVAHERTGLLVDPENTADIGDAILLLLKDPKYARELGDNGVKRVKEEFSWDKRAEELGKYI